MCGALGFIPQMQFKDNNPYVLQLPIKVVAVEGIELPTYATAGSAGMDLRAYGEYVIPAGGRVVVRTGLRVAVPLGWELQIRPRSGLALKYGITVLNSPGTIDSDYRGEIGVVLFNSSDVPFTVEKDMRIAQAVVQQVVHCVWESVEGLDITDRGAGGFGSTGTE